MCDTIKWTLWALELYWYQIINFFFTHSSLVLFLCILIKKTTTKLLLVRVNVPFSFPRLCSMLWPAAIIWGVLPTLHYYLGVNCSALCEWIFGKCPLMTLYVSPPALFTPRIRYWIYWLFYRLEVNRSDIGLSLPEGQQKGQMALRETWSETRSTKGFTLVKILIIASFFSFRVVCLCF